MQIVTDLTLFIQTCGSFIIQMKTGQELLTCGFVDQLCYQALDQKKLKIKKNMSDIGQFTKAWSLWEQKSIKRRIKVNLELHLQ